MSNKKEVYRDYPLKKSLTINGRKITQIIISSHYEEKHADYLNDEIILQLTKQLDNKRFEAEDKKENWEYFSFSPLFYQFPFLRFWFSS